MNLFRYLFFFRRTPEFLFICTGILCIRQPCFRLLRPCCQLIGSIPLLTFFHVGSAVSVFSIAYLVDTFSYNIWISFICYQECAFVSFALHYRTVGISVPSDITFFRWVYLLLIIFLSSAWPTWIAASVFPLTGRKPNVSSQVVGKQWLIRIKLSGCTF